MSSSVSVVIPTYERPDFLRGALETALNQTHTPSEVIVVDDGSSTGYAERIVDEYPDLVDCFHHNQNKGLSAARNTGIRESTGKYVAFLDDDDRWHETKLSKQATALDDDDSAAIATCLLVAIRPDNEIVHCETEMPEGNCANAVLTGNQIGTPSRVLVRRRAATDIGGFDESLPTKQDWDFYLRLCSEWNVTGVAEHLCFRTVHESMSSSVEAIKRDKQSILQKHEERIRRRGLWTEANAEVSERIGRANLHDGNLGTAQRYLASSIRVEPTLRRGMLLGLSLTHPRVVDGVIAVKRKISLRRNDCLELSQEFNAVPGLDE